jgi:hypothetical protein
MHAEMHAIFNVTGVAPSFKQQVQGPESYLRQFKRKRPNQAKDAAKATSIAENAGTERNLSRVQFSVEEDEACRESREWPYFKGGQYTDAASVGC